MISIHELRNINYRPQRSWAKVIFSQACVCPQGGRGVCLGACWDTYPPGSRHPPEQTHTPLGADTPLGPLWCRHPPRAGTPPGGPGTPPEQTPPREADSSTRSTSGRYAPTGMHSCYKYFCRVHKKLILFRKKY